MTIQPINKINELVGTGLSDQSSDNGTPFSSFFSAAVENIEEVNQLQKDAEQMSVDFAIGKIDNVADVMIAQEKASIALQYTVQLRTKLLDAYNEIMRIQV